MPRHVRASEFAQVPIPYLPIAETRYQCGNTANDHYKQNERDRDSRGNAQKRKMQNFAHLQLLSI
jgi:hypothetical protein